MVRDVADEDVEIVVRDDGQGFDAGAAGASEGFGLLGMRERVALVGGSLSVTSSPGRGAEIKARIPARRRAASPDGSAATPRAATLS
jgi:signal transduction histidine kinase